MAPDSQHPRLSAALADLSDAEMITLLAHAEPLGVGIGGSTARVRIDGSDVFVKQLPVTDLESNDQTSTANPFELPVACHYGIGSPGFGVGREIAAHELTSNWVTSGVTDIFPILYHWRRLDLRCDTDVSELTGVAAQRQWGLHWPKVRGRVDALTTAESSVAIFLEYAPRTLDQWLRRQFASGRGGAALSHSIEQIVAATAWMDANGLQHLDLHPRNILVHDGRFLFTDFGLALHKDFGMGRHERAFFDSHHRQDHDTAITSLLHWTLAELGVGSRAERLRMLRAAAADPSAGELDPVRADLMGSADIIARYAAIGASTTALFDELAVDASSAG
jgi:hypothetical protein